MPFASITNSTLCGSLLLCPPFSQHDKQVHQSRSSKEVSSLIDQHVYVRVCQYRAKRASLTHSLCPSVSALFRSMYADAAADKSSVSQTEQQSGTRKRGRRGTKESSVIDDSFEDVLQPAAAASKASSATAAASAGKASGKQANGKKAVVEWHDEDDEDDSSLASKAAKREQSKVDRTKLNKRRKTEQREAAPPAATLPAPPALRTPSEPIFSAAPSSLSSSSSSLSPSIPRDLFSFIESTLRDDMAQLEAVYGQSDATSSSSSSSSSSSQQQPHQYISSALTQITDSFLASLASQLQADTSSLSSSSSPLKQAAAGSSREPSTAPSPLLAFYSSLVALLPSRVEQAKQYAASLSTHSTLPSPSLSLTDTAPLSPTASAASSSSSSSSPSVLPMSSVIQSGFSALSINTDIVLGELRERKRELEGQRKWRERVTERLNKQATGALDASREDEEKGAAGDEETTEKTRKNRLIKRIIKGS